MGLSRGVFGALTVDMRDLGRSIWRPSLTGSSEIYDVVAVCNLVFVSLSATRILLVGLMQRKEKTEDSIRAGKSFPSRQQAILVWSMAFDLYAL